MKGSFRALSSAAVLFQPGAHRLRALQPGGGKGLLQEGVNGLFRVVAADERLDGGENLPGGQGNGAPQHFPEHGLFGRFVIIAQGHGHALFRHVEIAVHIRSSRWVSALTRSKEASQMRKALPSRVEVRELTRLARTMSRGARAVMSA